MAEISRLSGAILVRSEGNYYLVGDLKEPCNFKAKGFDDPGEIAPLERPFLRLSVSGDPVISGRVIVVKTEGELLCRILSERFLIKRNGSVSNRLWDLIFDAKENAGKEIIHADWLVEMPSSIWEIVREEVLKCV